MDDTDRNPSPPPELLQSSDFVPDKIGDSVFSKQNLFQILISIYETTKKESSEDVAYKLSSDEPNNIMELDSKVEEDACTLWDMSADNDVAHFLQELNATDIFIEIIEKTKSPRLLEIIVGILGNFASFVDICEDMSKNCRLLNTVMELIGSSDSPTLIQVFRLIHSGIVSKHSSDLWFEAVVSNSSSIESLKFVLKNSLNGEVLKGGLQLLYYILDKDDSLCINWGEYCCVESIIESGQQLSALGDSELLDEFWLVLNLLCQYEKCISALAVHCSKICAIFLGYIVTLQDSEGISPPVHRVTAIAAAVSTISSFIKYDEANKKLMEGACFFPRLLEMHDSIKALLSDRNNQSNNGKCNYASENKMNMSPSGSTTKVVEDHFEEHLLDSSISRDEDNEMDSEQIFGSLSSYFRDLIVLKETLEEFDSLMHAN